MSKPSQPPRRRWLRFSLASLLAVTTVLCIALAVVFNRVRRQERAVRAIHEAGGFIMFDYQRGYLDRNPLTSDMSDAPIPGSPWLRRVVGDEFFRSPMQITLNASYPHSDSYSDVDDALLIEHLGGVRTADALFIESPDITDAALPYVGAMKRVDLLGLSSEQVTDEGLRQLTGMRQLLTLRLDCPQVTDVGVEHLKTLDQLAELTLNCPRLTPSGIRRLEGLTKVRQAVSLKSQANHALLDTLQRAHSRDPFDPPLLAALESLSADAGLPIDTSNLLPDHQLAPIRLTTATTVEGCLDQILEPAGLGWYLHEGTVKITTRALARERRAGYYAFRETFPNAELIWVDW